MSYKSIFSDYGKHIREWNQQSWCRYRSLTVLSWWKWLGEAVLPFPVQQNGCRTPDTEIGFQMFADILLVIMLEATKTTGMKQDKNHYNFSIAHAVWFVSLLGILIFNHIFFLLQRKFLAKIIGHTINLCNFRLCEHSGNRLNVIIRHYKFNTLLLYPYFSIDYIYSYIELTLV